ncbi:MAG: SAM-dependent methyltransferase, partial [Puniceicoccales bacterium]|nr:SAM-dependent methyltransferase [Puniceicoccales bacterium]
MSDTPSSATPSKNHYDHDPLSALDAIGEAQRIAFAPILFQAAVCLRDLGILRQLEQRGDAGATRHELAEACSLSDYGAGVLLDMGLSGRLVFQQGEKFFLAKTGHFLLNDKMTRVNMDFTRDICYAGMARLKEAVTAGTPAGLEVFGKWPTIYPALSSLPEPAKTSWFAFDHFYSDCAFGPALAHIFQYKPALIYDVGGNTGRWALRCVGHDPDVRVTVLDLPQQVVLLKKETATAPNGERIDGIGLDILGEGDLPGEAD